MSRPHINYGINDLENLVASPGCDRATLNAVHAELVHRKTPRAKKLQAKVQEKLSGNNSSGTSTSNSQARAGQKPHQKPPPPHQKSQQKTESQGSPGATNSNASQEDGRASQKTGPGGTSNKNGRSNDSGSSDTQRENGWSFFKDSSDLIQNFISALELEVSAIKKRSQEASIDLRNGVLIEEAADAFLYRFPMEEEINLHDDSPIVIVVGGQETSGSVVSTANKAVILSLDDDFGKHISFAQIKIDNSFLVDRLREQFVSLDDKDKVAFFNKDLFEKILGEALPLTSCEAELIVQRDSLNESQWQAVKMAGGSEVMFLWGPPGTGKTYSLAKIIEEFYRRGKRVLLVSNTNLAVDTLLEKLCTVLHSQQDEGFQKGAVLRSGTIAKEELRESYGEYVNVDLVVERLSKDLQEEKINIQGRLAEIEKQVLPLQAMLQSFDELEEVERFLSSITKNWVSQQQEEGELKKKIVFYKRERANLDAELERARYAGTLKRLFTGLNPEKIQKRIEENGRQKKEAIERLRGISGQIAEKVAKKNELLQRFEQCQRKTSGKDKGAVQAELQKMTTEVDPLRSRLHEVNASLNKVKQEVLNNCRIFAATATQTYLKSKEFVSFDVVVIDEASMLILPLVSYVAGLAKEQVIVTGDFRQLPPIITSDDKKVIKWLGSTVFEKAGIVEAVNNRTSPENLISLNIQYRMEERICSLINASFYNGLLETGRGAGSQKEPGAYPDILEQCLTIIDTSHEYPFVNYKARTWSRYNVLHAVAIRNLAHAFQKEGFIQTSHDLGVVSPYSAQAKFIGSLCDELGLHDVTSGTVHKFQGNEKDVIIFDVADSYGLRSPSKFIQASSIEESGAKLLNVAVSRARSKLVIFANLEYIKNKLPPGAILRNILFDMERNGRVIDVKDVLKLGPCDFPTSLSQARPTGFQYEPGRANLFDEKSFNRAFLQDMHAAKHAITIFSAFLTPRRLAFWSDTFRQKIHSGIKIRVLTRPASNQGNIDAETVREAIELMHKMGVTVDLRNDMHEKICFIDDQVLWHGSLNPMSHTGKTNESMMRLASPEACRTMAEFLTFRYSGKLKDCSTINLIAERENPFCEKCGSLTVFYSRSRNGPYYKCADQCGWSVNFDRASHGRNNRNASGGDAKGEDSRSCDCGKPMVIRSGRNGRFWGCSGYPDCRNTVNIR